VSAELRVLVEGGVDAVKIGVVVMCRVLEEPTVVEPLVSDFVTAHRKYFPASAATVV
jgi:hypothetical protein